MVAQIPNTERRNLSAVAHEMTMIRGLPPHIGFFMGWADGFRPSLMKEPGSSTTSDDLTDRLFL
jgi:hypothetical protein